jgi:hypothetical protein
MSSNPFLSQWLSAANSAAGGLRGFWSAEMARQQTAMITEFQRQAMQFWTGAWARQLATVQAGTVEPPAPPAAASSETAPEGDRAPAPATVEPKPIRAAKRPVQLRTAVERRTVAKGGKRGKASGKAKGRAGRPLTRH